MKLPPFLLDQWLDHHKGAGIEHDLASSTGPAWSVQELLALANEDERGALLLAPIVYGVAAGSEALRAGIAALHGAAADEVLVTTGASEALHILFFAAAEPGANVVVSDPGFPPTSTLPAALGLEVRTYRLRPQDGFRIDLDEVRRLVDRRTRVVLATSPHNPTGAVLRQDEHSALAEIAAAQGALFVTDEVYHPLYLGPSRPSAAADSRAVVVGDLSKALCLSGLRLGYLIDRDPVRRERWLNTRMHFTITSTSFGEALGALALRHREIVLARARARVEANVALFAHTLERVSGLVDWVAPAGGTVSFPWLASGGDSRPFAEALAARGVLLVPGDCFGHASHFRLGFGADPRFAEAMAVFEAAAHEVLGAASLSAPPAALRR